ncbi:MAG TPA: metalloregulator ArsR/SmtB family transcription factor [Thermoplasmata archaeon]|nr:metalloregulator ArsR/SmtB family transcription factor [Thermoplasmata archaeon]
MTPPTPDRILGERLERLTGEDAACCVPEYRTLAGEILEGAAFPSALRRVKALADEHRLLALALLKRRGELCACEIQAATGLTHATVSHHMAVLEDAGLVRSRRKQKWMYYRLGGAPGVGIP